jgi:Flp pilus assembly protein TadD
MTRSAYTAVLLAVAAALAACQETPQRPMGEAVDQTLRQGAADAAARGGWSEAASSWRLHYERNPNDAEAAAGLVRSLRLAGRIDEAVKIGAEASQRMPGDARLLAEYGKARLAARDVEGAVPVLRAALAQAPGDWTLLSALGIADDLRGRHVEAQASYLKALELAPNNPAVTNNLALSLALSGNIDAGIVRLLELQAPLRGGTPQTRQSLALLYAMKGDLAAAERLVGADLPPKLANENMAYYRLLAGLQGAP